MIVELNRQKKLSFVIKWENQTFEERKHILSFFILFFFHWNKEYRIKLPNEKVKYVPRIFQMDYQLC